MGISIALGAGLGIFFEFAFDVTGFGIANRTLLGIVFSIFSSVKCTQYILWKDV